MSAPCGVICVSVPLCKRFRLHKRMTKLPMRICPPIVLRMVSKFTRCRYHCCCCTFILRLWNKPVCCIKLRMPAQSRTGIVIDMVLTGLTPSHAGMLPTSCKRGLKWNSFVTLLITREECNRLQPTKYFVPV